jgi:hypothetical protein
MWTLLAFLVERLVVSLPDILLAGGGAFLATWHGRKRIIGIILLVIYFMSIVGTFIGDSPPSLDPDDPRSFGIVFGVIAAVGGWLLGRKLRQRSGQLNPSHL